MNIFERLKICEENTKNNKCNNECPFFNQCKPCMPKDYLEKIKKEN